jgi:hypothetical protein
LPDFNPGSHFYKRQAIGSNQFPEDLFNATLHANCPDLDNDLFDDA